MKPTQDSPEFASAISVQQMRDSDAYTIAHYIPSKELMYRAAYGVYSAVDWRGKSVAILAGSGNNGGDGYALAGILAKNGIMPVIFQTSTKCSEDGAYYHQLAQEAGVNIMLFTPEIKLDGFDIVVDCILGTGFQGVPRGLAASAIEQLNRTKTYVVSVDINSGLNGDTGEAALAVRSDKTVSIGYYKRGLFLGRGPELIGDLVNVDIGIHLINEAGEEC